MPPADIGLGLGLAGPQVARSGDPRGKGPKVKKYGKVKKIRKACCAYKVLGLGLAGRQAAGMAIPSERAQK